jgi:integrase
MNPDTVEQTVARLMEKHAQTTAYQTAHRAIEGFWVWATDRGIPDLQPAPRDLSELMPRAPAHAPPTDTATWAEMDACIGRIIGKRPEVVQSNVVAAYWSAVIQRYTGIRQFQAVGILREECDTEGNTLLIRRGKSPGEKALNRRVAVSKHLFQDLTPLLDAVASGPLFPDRRHPDEPIRSYRNTTRYIRRGWELATDDGNARKTVWLQPNKNKPNITQAFRGGFQHGLEEAGVRDSTISFLVGHAAQSTRQRHYTRPSMDMMWRAVQHIPKIAEPSAR